jgi:hypothetical protein
MGDMNVKLTQPRPCHGLLILTLPGPDRRRSLAMYQYRVIYRNPTPAETGCVMTWDVSGGRLPYQISLERTADDGLLWHCSCADAVYRGEDDPAHVCKHVRGLIDTLPVAPPVRKAVAA